MTTAHSDQLLVLAATGAVRALLFWFRKYTFVRRTSITET
jgi:hypothetical protein